MSRFEVLENHTTFASASSRARELALRYGEATTIYQCKEGWEVQYVVESTLKTLETHESFESASTQAKKMAIRFREITSIERCDTGWAVLVSTGVLSILEAHDTAIDDYDDYDEPWVDPKGCGQYQPESEWREILGDDVYDLLDP